MRKLVTVGLAILLVFLGGVMIGSVTDPTSAFSSDDGHGGVEAVEAGFSFWAASQPFGNNVRSLACTDGHGRRETIHLRRDLLWGDPSVSDVTCDEERCSTNLDGDPIFFARIESAGAGEGGEFTLAPTFSCLTADAPGRDRRKRDERQTRSPRREPRHRRRLRQTPPSTSSSRTIPMRLSRPQSRWMRLGSSLGGGDDLAATSSNVVMYSNAAKISAEREDQIKSCLR